jgi:hypothetical protein
VGGKKVCSCCEQPGERQQAEAVIARITRKTVD